MKYFCIYYYSKTIHDAYRIIYEDKDITFFAIIITFCNFFLAKCKLFPFFTPLLRLLLT